MELPEYKIEDQEENPHIKINLEQYKEKQLDPEIYTLMVESRLNGNNDPNPFDNLIDHGMPPINVVKNQTHKIKSEPFEMIDKFQDFNEEEKQI